MPEQLQKFNKERTKRLIALQIVNDVLIFIFSHLHI
jgi:hypothetical protein